MKALQDVALRIQRADCLETLVDSILEGLEESFGFKHSTILVPTEEPGVLVTIATRGYADNGVGAEVRFGEGIAGLGVPLLVRGELVGVLCLESDVRYRFHEEDKASIELLGSYLAIAIQNVQMQEQAGQPAAAEPDAAASGRSLTTRTDTAAHDVVYYAGDECILVDGEYLIRSLPAKILWRLLCIHQASGRAEFTNRELRLDKSLNLPEWKDNLESRLILLRRRLEQKCPDIRLTPTARGRFRLDLAGAIELSTKP